MRAEYSLILDDPAPCDDCQHAELCKYSGSACKAFSAYVGNKPWEGISRNPTLRQGKVLGIEPAEMDDATRERLMLAVME